MKTFKQQRKLLWKVPISIDSHYVIFSEVWSVKSGTGKFLLALWNFDLKNRHPDSLRPVIVGGETWVYSYDD